MAFVTVCPVSAVKEGDHRVYRVEKKSILLVWPTGSQLKAYRGRCPHQDTTFDKTTFDGKTLECCYHMWRFDSETGIAIHPRGRGDLKPYAVRVEGDVIQVDTAS